MDPALDHVDENAAGRRLGIDDQPTAFRREAAIVDLTRNWDFRFMAGAHVNEAQHATVNVARNQTPAGRPPKALDFDIAWHFTHDLAAVRIPDSRWSSAISPRMTDHHQPRTVRGKVQIKNLRPGDDASRPITHKHEHARADGQQKAEIENPRDQPAKK